MPKFKIYKQKSECRVTPAFLACCLSISTSSIRQLPCKQTFS